MKKIVLLLFVLVATSCSSIANNKMFDRFKDRFAEDYERITGKVIEDWFWDIPINFVKEHKGNEDALGVCHWHKKPFENFNYITINLRDWNTTIANEISREIVVFHELGHCYLYREHTEDFSIMRKYVMRHNTYFWNRERLLKELFKEVE